MYSQYISIPKCSAPVKFLFADSGIFTDFLFVGRVGPASVMQETTSPYRAALTPQKGVSCPFLERDSRRKKEVSSSAQAALSSAAGASQCIRLKILRKRSSKVIFSVGESVKTPENFPDFTHGKWERPAAPHTGKYSLDVIVEDRDTPIIPEGTRD